MAAADGANGSEQLQRFINTLWQHQQNNLYCDVTLMADDASIQCHKVVLSSASSYFSELLRDSGHNTTILDVTPLSEQILRIAVAFMYNSDYVIDDDNVIELYKLSMTWNLDILAKLCMAYVSDNLNLNNVCRFYNFASDNLDQPSCHSTQTLSKMIRVHFTRLHELGHLSELSLKNFTTIIEHDKINVKNEDVIFHSAVQVINEHSTSEDILDCLKKIRFPHISDENFLGIFSHPLMADPARAKYIVDATFLKMDRPCTSEIKPPRYWGRDIYYIGNNHCLYQYGSQCHNVEVLPDWVNDGSSMASHKELVVIVEGWSHGPVNNRVLLFDMADMPVNTQEVNLPSLPELHSYTGVSLSDTGMYVVGVSNSHSDHMSSLYYLSFSSDVWQIKKPLPYTVWTPLVIQHQQFVYVLGGCNINGEQSSVSRYSIEDDTWMRCSDLPVRCSSDTAGVVVYHSRLTVVTVDSCVVYDANTDTWTGQHYNKLGYNVNAFIKRGQIWAAVLRDVGCSLMSYDGVHNVWTTEHEHAENAIKTKLFC